ncbi:MAG TPA: hypothetical protein VFY87_00520, partial [Geminicoccaceae bacterium]|nr:hypothetical protein [Geminicoccaceae bacterium]
ARAGRLPGPAVLGRDGGAGRPDRQDVGVEIGLERGVGVECVDAGLEVPRGQGQVADRPLETRQRPGGGG